MKVLPVDNKSLETTDDVMAEKLYNMAVSENIIDEVSSAVFLLRKIIADADLLVVIKNRYLNLRTCTLRRSVKKFWQLSYGVKKRMSPADGTIDIAVQYKLSYRNVRLFTKSTI